MSELDGLVRKIPDDWYDIKDCWKVACKIVALQMKRNEKPLDLNAYFFYNKDEKRDFPQGFEGIVRKNISVAEDREARQEVEREYEFLRQFVGLECRGRSYSGKDACEYAKGFVWNGASCILWIDTFYAEWSAMFNQVHFPHCVVILKMTSEKSTIFDAFRKEEPCFEVENKHLFEITNFVNIFCYDNKFKGFINNDEMITLFVRNFIIKYSSIDEYIGVLKLVSNDLEKIGCNLDKELEDENTIKLTMRIFVNQYQKGSAQLECFKQANNVGVEMLGLCEDIVELWRNCAGVFAKICYLPSERRRIKFEHLCKYVKEIQEKLVLFNNIIKEEAI